MKYYSFLKFLETEITASYKKTVDNVTKGKNYFFLSLSFIMTEIIFKITPRTSLSRPKKHVFGSEGMVAGMG